MNFKPHHIALTVRNIEESVLWYCDKLGFRVVHKYEKNGMEIVHLVLGEVRIELFHYESTELLPDYRKNLLGDLHVIGTKHLCIEVDDLTEVIKQLQKKEVEFVSELDSATFGGKYIFFKDCNGILLELYQS